MSCSPPVFTSLFFFPLVSLSLSLNDVQCFRDCTQGQQTFKGVRSAITVDRKSVV